MAWRKYQNLTIPIVTNVGIRETYSVTSDILSFQLCKRQYGFFSVRRYQPAHVVQIWFGTILHQVLDKLHLHYLGLLDPNTINQVPSDQDVVLYFNQVEESLRARGIRAINPDLRDTALRVLRIFNRIEGSTLYPNVVDTECSFQTDQGNYILKGVVDVLRDTSVAMNIPNYDSVEIWDYKGSKFPDIRKQDGRRKLERYTFQMLTYAELYRLKKGNYPVKGILYFMNELNSTPEPTTRPAKAVFEIDFRDPSNILLITQAMNSFSQVVNDIEQCKTNDRWDPLNPLQRPDRETCDICDLRWNCPTVKGNYQMRHP